MKRKLLIVGICIASMLIVGATAVYMAHKYHNRIHIVGYPKEKTNEHQVYQDETPIADSALVGKWQNQDNPQWFKSYYDDYDGDGFFWGKEWNEAENVYEEDLNYHGNGWFRWRIDKDQLLEMHTMDAQDTPIPKRWRVRLQSFPDSLILFSVDVRNQYLCFGRVKN